jgi:D-alanyl-D-alanine carboxypeptidase/D-alanyl-D-alanine-endopeptidase (penicillin-binding protein 4)
MPLNRAPAALLLLTALAHAQTPAPAATAKPAPVYPTGPSTPLGAQIASLLADQTVSRAHWGIAVTALDGTPIYGLDEGQLFRPASVAKLFTTTTAMALLGAASTVTTTLQTNGAVLSDGTLNGDVILIGTGDANLSGRHLPYETPAQAKARLGKSTKDAPNPLAPLDDFAAQLSAKGITRITGQVYGDDSIWPHDLYAQGWEIEDIPWGYGAPVSALSINDNQIEITVASVGPGLPLVTSSPASLFGMPVISNEIRIVPADQPTSIDVDRDDLNSDTLHFRGTLSAGKTDVEEVANLIPAEFAALALADVLKAHGIANGGGVGSSASVPGASSFAASARQPISNLTPERAPAAPNVGECMSRCITLASRVSAPLAEDVTIALKVSQNLHAELMLRRLGAIYGAAGTFLQGARVVRQYLLNAGLDGNDFIFYDGSGLSTKDLVTPRATAQLLAYAATQPWFPQWKPALPVGGVDGTLSNRFTAAPLKGHVFAKTGTLGESRALAGYLDAASGRTLIFSILVDNHTPGSNADRVVMDKIVAAIAAAN